MKIFPFLIHRKQKDNGSMLFVSFAKSQIYCRFSDILQEFLLDMMMRRTFCFKCKLEVTGDPVDCFRLFDNEMIYIRPLRRDTTEDKFHKP